MDHDLIDAYLIELRRVLRWRTDLDDVCAEVEDHLRENADKLVAAGVAPGEAQRRTLECFGDLGLVARSFAVAPSGALAVPTSFTRLSGRIAIWAAFAWLLAALTGWTAQDSLLLEGWSTGRYLIFALTTMLAAGLTTVALVGLAIRAAGDRSRNTFAVLALGVIGSVAVGAMAWLWAALALLLTIAAALALRGVRGVGLGRPVAAGMLLAAWPLGAGALYLLNVARPIGPVDQYGDYPVAWAMSFSLAAALFAAGLIGYGRVLFREVPADLPFPSPTAPSPLAG